MHIVFAEFQLTFRRAAYVTCLRPCLDCPNGSKWFHQMWYKHLESENAELLMAYQIVIAITDSSFVRWLIATLMDRSHIWQATQQTLHNLLQITAFIVTTVLPALIQLIWRHLVKEPYHTSILTGQGWVNELLYGHPNRIRTELDVKKDVFLALTSKLRKMGHADSKYLLLEEQLAIFLYA